MKFNVPGLLNPRATLLTLRKTLIGQRNLTREQIKAETTENAAEGRDGDETVGSARLEERATTTVNRASVI